MEEAEKQKACWIQQKKSRLDEEYCGSSRFAQRKKSISHGVELSVPEMPLTEMPVMSELRDKIKGGGG